MKQLIVALKITALFTVLTGLLYPAVVTVLAKALFPARSAGSMIAVNGKAAGSELIGQRFTRPEYFHGRPSAAGSDGYDAMASGGSNYGPTNQKLIDRVAGDAKKFHEENPDQSGPLPADLLTASASGLDPDVSPASAEAQVSRVARARGVDPQLVASLVRAQAEGRQWGLLGEPRVNVLKLNLALDRSFPRNR